MEFLSTTALSNELNIPTNELFAKLKGLGWIDRNADKWLLTEMGKQKGGQTRSNPKYGEFIVWPEVLADEMHVGQSKQYSQPTLLTSTLIGKHFNVSNQRLNLILSELGWIEKDIAGWQLTKQGKVIGGRQFESDSSGQTYVKWPQNILGNISLKHVFDETPTEKEIANIPIEIQTAAQLPSQENFRNKYPTPHRTKDGHFVRSKAEVIIDNALYDYKVIHAYERKLPIDEDLLSDFYLPAGNVYIEYWGMENDPSYVERKKKKIEIYKKHEFSLIELNDTDVSNLDDILPKKLLKFGIKVY